MTWTLLHDAISTVDSPVFSRARGNGRNNGVSRRAGLGNPPPHIRALLDEHDEPITANYLAAISFMSSLFLGGNEGTTGVGQRWKAILDNLKSPNGGYRDDAKVDHEGKYPIHFSSLYCKRSFSIESGNHSSRRQPSTVARNSNGPTDSITNNEGQVSPQEVLIAIAEAYPRALLYSFPDADQFLPLQKALESSLSPSMVIQRMVELCPESCQMPNAKGDVPLHVACGLCKDPSNSSTTTVSTAARSVATAAAAVADASARVTSETSNESAGGTTRKTALEIVLHAFPAALGTVNTQGDTPLHVALNNWSMTLKYIKLLAKAYPPALSIPNKAGELPLHIACQKRSEDFVMFLLEEYPEGATAVTNEQRFTPFHCASQNSSLTKGSLEKLYDVIFSVHENSHSRDNVGHQNSNYTETLQSRFLLHSGPTPFHLACKAIHSNFEASRLRFLYETNPQALFALDERFNSPLSYPPSHTCQRIFQVLQEATPMIWDLRDDRNGNTLLHHSCVGRSGGMILDLVSKLKPQLASVTNRSGELPIHVRLKRGPRRGMASDSRKLLREAPQHSAILDPLEKLMPFMLAATCNNEVGAIRPDGCLNTTFVLLKYFLGFSSLEQFIS